MANAAPNGNPTAAATTVAEKLTVRESATMCVSWVVPRAAHTSNSHPLGSWPGASLFELLGFRGHGVFSHLQRLKVNYVACHDFGSSSPLHARRAGSGGRDAGDAVCRATGPDNQGALG